MVCQVGSRVPVVVVVLGAVAAPRLRGVAGQAFDVRVRLRREAAVFGVYETDYSVAVVESRVVVVTNVNGSLLLVQYKYYFRALQLFMKK